MATVNALSEVELLSRLSSLASSRGGTAAFPDEHSVRGTLTAIGARWFLGGRKVLNTFICTLDPATHEARFRESAVESSWGVPPPSLTVQTTHQRGIRVQETRVDKGVGGGGKLEFGRFRESVEQAVKDAGWDFVYEVA